MSTDATVDPDSKSPPHQPGRLLRVVPPRLWSALGVMCAVAALTLIQVFRSRGVSTYRTIWAEDGPVFLLGGLRGVSLFEEHAGYGQFVSRVVGWAAAQVSLDDASVVLAVVPSLLTALLAVTVYWLSDYLVSSRMLRAVIAASFVLPGVLIGETAANAANLQWPLLAASFWALIRPLRSWRDGLTCGALAMTAALSSGVAFVFLPLAALVIALRRTRVGALVPTMFIAACAAQAIITLTATTSAVQGKSRIGDLPTLYIVRVIGGATLGERAVAEVWVNLGVALTIMLGLVAAGVLIALLLRNDHEGRLWGLAAIAMSLVLFCATSYYRGTKEISLGDGMWNGGAGRYVGCALQLFVAGAVILIARARLEGAWRRAIVWGLAAQAIVIPALSGRPQTGRSDGPTWESAVKLAHKSCAADPALLEIYVETVPKGWGLPLPCSAVP